MVEVSVKQDQPWTDNCWIWVISIHYTICIGLLFKNRKKRERENTRRLTKQVCEPRQGDNPDGRFAKSALFGGGGDVESHTTTLSPGARAGFLKKHVILYLENWRGRNILFRDRNYRMVTSEILARGIWFKKSEKQFFLLWLLMINKTIFIT